MLAVVDCRIHQKAENALRALGFDTLKLPPHPALPPPVASHPDMLLFFAPDAILCTESYRKIAEKELFFLSASCKREIRTVKEEYGTAYPRDILLNAAAIGERLFCLPRYTAKELTDRYRACPVKQGYAKCSVLPVGEAALITADPSIARAARQEGLEVLQITQNAVALTGYDTGFLGGAASFSPDNRCKTIFFCGSLDAHPSAEEIKRFITAHGFDFVSLTPDPLTDVGTMFII